MMNYNANTTNNNNKHQRCQDHQHYGSHECVNLLSRLLRVACILLLLLFLAWTNQIVAVQK